MFEWVRFYLAELGANDIMLTAFLADILGNVLACFIAREHPKTNEHESDDRGGNHQGRQHVGKQSKHAHPPEIPRRNRKQSNETMLTAVSCASSLGHAVAS